MVQVESTSKVMMAALAELTEKAAALKNGSAEPHVLRPLPFLIYLADQEGPPAVRGPSPPPCPLRRSPALPCRPCRALGDLQRPAHPALPLSPPRPPWQGAYTFNVFSNAAPLKPVMRVFKRHPEVGCSPPPEVFKEEGESEGVIMRLAVVLQRCPHYASHMAPKWDAAAESGACDSCCSMQ